MGKRYRMILQMFEGDGKQVTPVEGGDGTSARHIGADSHGAGYTHAQLEEIASSRAEKASQTALKEFFRKQGMSEEDINTAIQDFKEKQKASRQDVAAVERERDSYKDQLEQLQHTGYLRDKGVRSEDLDYVLFKVGKLVDEKTDFNKAADKFLKDNPRYTGQVYRVSASSGSNTQGSGTSVSASINDAIRNAARR